jgi:hypothetical protein
VPRLWLVLLTLAVLTACTDEGPFVGNAMPPKTQRLVYINGDEGGSLDPGMFPGGREAPIINALFEPAIFRGLPIRWLRPT